MVIKDSKKWQDRFALWQELEKKNGKGNDNTSTDGVIDLDAQEPCLGNHEGEGLASASRKCRPPGHKATKADIVWQADSFAFQETSKQLMVKKEEVIVGREEWQHRDKEATTKSFIDLQERSVAAGEAIKARIMELEAKTKALEAEAKARLLEAEARTKLFKTEAKTKLL
jgi:hypothetical protein